MIFSFTGAQCTGKTTLLKHLYKENGDYPFVFVPEVTRLVKREYNMPINESGDDLTQMLIMTEHVRNIFRDRADHIVRGVHQILDRCALDGIVYSHYLLDNKKIGRATFDACELIYKKIINKYDVIFYTSHEDVELVDDGERSVDKIFREDIIGLFDMYMQYNIIEKGPRVVHLEGTVKERLKTIKSTLDKLNIAIKI
jgi:nicotinamide riboside kinase|tara:strand:- start:967 stop:1560 length:594 start_codon:yes stop_codon:yes gene_type:complete